MNPFGKTELKHGKTSHVSMGRLPVVKKSLSTNFESCSKEFQTMDFNYFAWLNGWQLTFFKQKRSLC